MNGYIIRKCTFVCKTNTLQLHQAVANVLDELSNNNHFPLKCKKTRQRIKLSKSNHDCEGKVHWRKQSINEWCFGVLGHVLRQPHRWWISGPEVCNSSFHREPVIGGYSSYRPNACPNNAVLSCITDGETARYRGRNVEQGRKQGSTTGLGQPMGPRKKARFGARWNFALARTAPCLPVSRQKRGFSREEPSCNEPASTRRQFRLMLRRGPRRVL